MLPAAAPVDDAARLTALFDVALDAGLVAVIVHFVTEASEPLPLHTPLYHILVDFRRANQASHAMQKSRAEPAASQVCLDPFAVSADPVAAQLMDGDLVASWAEAAAARLRQRVDTSLPSGFVAASPAASSALDDAAAGFASLLLVLRALAGSGSSLASAAPAPRAAAAAAAADEAQRRRQHASALAWASRAGLTGCGASHPRFLGSSAFAAAVSRRRAAAAALPDAEPTFLDDLLAAMGADAPSYPPESIEAAAKGIFLGGAADPDALLGKACSPGLRSRAAPCPVQPRS